MTTETTTNLPPCPLTDCEVGEHHYHDIDAYAIGEKHDCGSMARFGYRCYGAHQPAAPISLPEVTDEMIERATNTYVNAWRMDEGMRAALTEFRLALFAGIPQWQPIEHDQIKAGMRIRATTTYRDCVTTRTGVAHHTADDGIWYTERDRLLTGWAAPTTYEVDSATIPADPDADLVEKLIGLLDLTDSEDAREVIAAVRAHDEAVTGDE